MVPAAPAPVGLHVRVINLCYTLFRANWLVFIDLSENLNSEVGDCHPHIKKAGFHWCRAPHLLHLICELQKRGLGAPIKGLLRILFEVGENYEVVPDC